MSHTGNKSGQVAQRILDRLAADNMSQRWLAGQAGINTATFNRRVQGKSSFTLDELCSIARVFDMQVTDLVSMGERSA